MKLTGSFSISAIENALSSKIGMFPILNVIADNHAPINTYGARFLVVVAKKLNIPEVGYYNDQTFIAPAHEVKWTRGKE